MQGTGHSVRALLEKNAIINMETMTGKIIFIFIAAVFGLLSYNYLLERGFCVPVRGSLFRRQDYERRGNIKEALRNVRAYSPEDYERICSRVSSIEIVRFEDQVVPVVPLHALGAYFPEQDDLSAKGVIKVDREASLGYMSELERVLVHEACHAYQVQTLGDFSEAPCYSRAHKYLLSRPETPLEEKSAEFIEKQGEKFHTYCSLRSQAAPVARGECVFINYTADLKRMCVNIYFKKGGLNKSEKEICSDVKAVGYASNTFELKYPVEARSSGEYQFGFSPLGQ